MIGAWTYAVTVNFVPSYRDPADKIGQSDIGIVNKNNDKLDEEIGTATVTKKDNDDDAAYDAYDGEKREVKKSLGDLSNSVSRQTEHVEKRP